MSNLRTNVYNRRVTNNVTKQFEEVHGSDFKPVSNQNHMSDEEGLKRAYNSPNRYYHHRNKLFVAGTKDFPQDHIEDMTLPWENTLNLTKRGRDVEAYYRNHMTEIDTIIGHSLGGSVALSLEEKYRHDKIGIPGVGIKQVKTFGAPVVAANIGGGNPVVKELVVRGTTNLGAQIGGSVGAGVDSLTGFTDEGLFTAGLSSEGGKLGKKLGTRLTTRPENNPDRIRYYGDGISAFDFNAKRVWPSQEFLKNHNPHSYKGLSIPDKVEEHDLMVQPLTVQPSDTKA